LFRLTVELLREAFRRGEQNRGRGVTRLVRAHLPPPSLPPFQPRPPSSSIFLTRPEFPPRSLHRISSLTLLLSLICSSSMPRHSTDEGLVPLPSHLFSPRPTKNHSPSRQPCFSFSELRRDSRFSFAFFRAFKRFASTSTTSPTSITPFLVETDWLNYSPPNLPNHRWS